MKKYGIEIGRVDSFSGSINSIIIRYAGMVAEAMPELTEGEWCCVCDASNGTVLDVDFRDNDPARMAWANVADSGPDGLAEKWGVDLDALAQKMRGMTYAAQVAVIHVVAKFWRPESDAPRSFRETLLEAGAKIKAE